MTEPERTCIGCGRKAQQRELARFVAPQGVLEADARIHDRRVNVADRPDARPIFTWNLMPVPIGLIPRQGA